MEPYTICLFYYMCQRNQLLLKLSLLLFLLAGSNSLVGQSTPKDPWKAADKLLESIGGKEIWASTKILYVKEKAYPASLSYPVIAEFWRNLEHPSYCSMIVGDSIQRETQWTSDEGWVIRNGSRKDMSQEQLKEEVMNWYQEPYVMYHKLAVRDPSIRLKLVNDRKLEIYAVTDGRLLCWFRFDKSGKLLIWGNYYQNEISEHVYGPIKKIGEFKMPAWGTSTNGSWRFEYLDIKAVDNMGNE